jgi:predicted protein tyrosine phosphatase
MSSCILALYLCTLMGCGGGKSSSSSPASKAAAILTGGPTLSTSKLSFSSVASSSITIHWVGALSDLSTPLSALTYLAFYTTSNPGGTPTANAVKATWNPIGSAATGVTSATATSLSPNTTYYFIVLVTDRLGNTTLYTPASQATEAAAVTPDTIPPTLSLGRITASATTTSGTTLSWTAAADAVTSAVDLTYTVYASTSDLTTQADWENAEKATKKVAATANLTTTTLTGLTANTSYYFMVMVEDQAGNTTLYDAATVTTQAVVIPDTTPPVPGASGTLSISALTTTGFTVSWTAGTDDVTAQADLIYEVLYSTSQNQVDTMDHIIASNPSHSSVSAGEVSLALTSLSYNSLYWVNVMVIDAAGNQALYTAAAAVLLPYESAGPIAGNGGTMTTTNVGTNSMTVVWTAATDTVMAQTALTYTMYKSTDSNAVDNLTNIATNTNVTTVGTATGTTGTMSMAATGLTPNSTYYLNVVASNGTYPTAYNQITQSLVQSETTSPQVTNATITVPTTSTDTVKLIWQAATDTLVAQTDLTYTVYKSTYSNVVDNIAHINTITDTSSITSLGTVSASLGFMTMTATSLTAGTGYYFNVKVSNGYQPAAYTQVRAVTTPTQVYLYFTNASIPTNLAGNGSGNPRTGADNYCRSQQSAGSNYTAKCKNFQRAVISTSSSDTIALMPTNYVFPSTATVRDIAQNNVLATQWSDLWNYIPCQTVPAYTSCGGTNHVHSISGLSAPTYFFTGSTSAGNYNTDVACVSGGTSWNTTTNTVSFNYGDTDYTNAFMYYGATGCSNGLDTAGLMCVCW